MKIIISPQNKAYSEAQERISRLWMGIASVMSEQDGDIIVWRSNVNYDGTKRKGWFILGIYESAKVQIAYPMPMSLWDKCDFAEDRDKAPSIW